MNPTNYVITTTLFSVKQYVTGYIRRFDHKVTVELSKHREDAKDFGTTAAARGVVALIYNPYERDYQVEALAPCNPIKMIPTARTASWLEERVIK